ncbi:MAG: lysozyme inhibitor LprI family protein [Candidatus Kapaibacterium sp.]
MNRSGLHSSSFVLLAVIFCSLLPTFCSSSLKAQPGKEHHFYRIYTVAENMYPKNTADHRVYAQQMDSVLNFVYNGILRDYKSDTAFIHSLRAAERAWLEFRDASVDAIMSSSRSADDATKAQCRAEYFSTITRRRIEELNLWYSGKPLRDGGGFGYAQENMCSTYHTETEQERLHEKQK